MKNININKNSNQSGRSMIEMLGVLAIVGVLSVGGIAGYSKAMEKFKINQLLAGISQFVAEIRILFNGDYSSDGIAWVDLNKYGIELHGFTSLGGGVATNPLGGEFFTFADSDDRYIINLSLPKKACIDFVTHDWGSTSSTGFISLAVSSSDAHMWSDAFRNNNIDNDNCSVNTKNGIIYTCSPNGSIPVSLAATYCDCEDFDCFVQMKFQ